MFNLVIKAIEKEASGKPLSITVKYLIDGKTLNKNLSEFEKLNHIKLSPLNKKNFLADDGKQIRISGTESNPTDIILSKVKIDDSFSVDYFRNHLAGLIGTIQNEEVILLNIVIPEFGLFTNCFTDEKYFYRTFIEGLVLGNYSFDLYKSDKKTVKDLAVFISGSNYKFIQSAVKTSLNLMEGVLFTKDLQNEPGLNLTPDLLAKRISSKLKKQGIRVRIFDEKAYLEGYGWRKTARW